MKRLLLILLFPCPVFAQPTVKELVSHKENHFALVSEGAAPGIYYAPGEKTLVGKSAEFLAADIEKVSGMRPEVLATNEPGAGRMILVGTLGNSPLIDRLADLIREGDSLFGTPQTPQPVDTPDIVQGRLERNRGESPGGGVFPTLELAPTN